MSASPDYKRNPSDSQLNETIKLQLRKPKSWNWSLSTSKSSPHISVPTIQLFDSKGILLIEAKDNGNTDNVWTSKDNQFYVRSQSADQTNKILKKSDHDQQNKIHINSNNLRKGDVRSHSSGTYTSSTKSINTPSESRRRNERSLSNPQKKNSFTSYYDERRARNRDVRSRPYTVSSYNYPRLERSRSDVIERYLNRKESLKTENKPQLMYYEKTNIEDIKRKIKENAEQKQTIKKSRSEILSKNNDEFRTIKTNFNKRATLPYSLQFTEKRLQSNDPFQRKMKYVEASAKRALEDGYSRFITPHLFNSQSMHNMICRKNTPPVQENPKIDQDSSESDRWMTRTSCAGTLIVPEEDVPPTTQRRRSRKDRRTEPVTSETIASFLKTCGPEKENRVPSNDDTKTASTSNINRVDSSQLMTRNQLENSKKSRSVSNIRQNHSLLSNENRKETKRRRTKAYQRYRSDPGGIHNYQKWKGGSSEEDDDQLLQIIQRRILRESLIDEIVKLGQKARSNEARRKRSYSRHITCPIMDLSLDDKTKKPAEENGAQCLNTVQEDFKLKPNIINNTDVEANKQNVMAYSKAKTVPETANNLMDEVSSSTEESSESTEEMEADLINKEQSDKKLQNFKETPNENKTVDEESQDEKVESKEDNEENSKNEEEVIGDEYVYQKKHLSEEQDEDDDEEDVEEEEEEDEEEEEVHEQKENKNLEQGRGEELVMEAASKKSQDKKISEPSINKDLNNSTDTEYTEEEIEYEVEVDSNGEEVVRNPEDTAQEQNNVKNEDFRRSEDKVEEESEEESEEVVEEEVSETGEEVSNEEEEEDEDEDEKNEEPQKQNKKINKTNFLATDEAEEVSSDSDSDSDDESDSVSETGEAFPNDSQKSIKWADRKNINVSSVEKSDENSNYIVHRSSVEEEASIDDRPKSKRDRVRRDLGQKQNDRRSRTEAKAEVNFKEQTLTKHTPVSTASALSRHSREGFRRRPKSSAADDSESSDQLQNEDVDEKESRTEEEEARVSSGSQVHQERRLQRHDPPENSSRVDEVQSRMGANVSRHSAKGLHGRRTQSSGSICAGGKGRRASDEKGGAKGVCGSLPSYLEDQDTSSRNAASYNNNQHHRQGSYGKTDNSRALPLGEAAPLHWKFSDTQTNLCDQGYGSERSPEEEQPPSLLDNHNADGYDQCHRHLDPYSCYPFITPDSTFEVSLVKGSRGLGLSVTGGTDSGGSWPGLIRIKRLFPLQPAAACGLLNVGDLLLEVNGISLIGLTNYEALEVLRTTPNHVDLRVCRPPADVLNCVSPISEVPPPPPRRELPSSLSLSPPPNQFLLDDEMFTGQFDITMTKIQGSLGFTLRKEDDSALGHYVRALVREPALSDGRVQPGDKIIAVNDVEISAMSHEQAVQFLRQAGDVVKLRLYRDSSQTPVSTLSPNETTPRTSFIKKTHLRQEAVDMLNDIALRKISNQDIYCLSPTSSPRRIRRQMFPSNASQITDPADRYVADDDQFHEAFLKNKLEDDPFSSLFTTSDCSDKPSRPNSLDLCNSKGTPVITRKPKFNFSLAHNAYELNNLDADILDAPNLAYTLKDNVESAEVESTDSYPQEPVSMPHIPVDNPEFSHKNPAYQSAHPQCGAETPGGGTSESDKEAKMQKWKAVVFDADGKPKRETPEVAQNTNGSCKEECEQILAIELNRGWNSRLGFSLQGTTGNTFVSAVHSNSVAAKDGRLRAGDRVIKVNDESVEKMNTNEIIDLLRIVRGPVCIVVSRKIPKQDCKNRSNAEN